MVECVEKSECCSEQKKKVVDVDGALRLAGYGPFHYEFLAVCACCILSAGYQNGVTAYLLPAAQCELGLSYADIGFVNAAFLVGGTSSALFWGIIADISGRKKVLLITCLLDFFINIACCFVQNFIQLTIFRFLSGFIIGAPASLIFTFMAEFHASEDRSKVICFSGIFFTVSWLILPVVAWFALSLPVNIHLSSKFLLTPWRLFLFIMTLPDLITAIWLLRFPETPDFLTSKGKTKKALDVVKNMYSRNTGMCKEQFEVEEIKVAAKIDMDLKDENNTKFKALRIFQSIYFQIKIIFQKPLAANSFLMSTITFGNMFGYFGLGLWLPEIFTRFRHYHIENPNSPISLGNLMSNFKIPEQSNVTNCAPTFDTVVFQNTLAIGMTSFLGHLSSGFLAGRINRKIIPTLAMLQAGICAGAIYFLTDSLQILIVACMFQSAIATANMALSSITVDIFPTSVNAVGSCLVTCAGRIGAILSNVLFGYLMSSMCAVPLFSVAGILLFTGLLCLIIPNDKIK